MTDDDRDQLEAAEQDFSAAMVSNDPEMIRRCITEVWVLVTPERGPVPAERLLAVIADGSLVHDTMTKTTHHMLLMGDVATVTGRGKNRCRYAGAAISADEWITDVYRRIDGKWRCALTHLTPACPSLQQPLLK